MMRSFWYLAPALMLALAACDPPGETGEGGSAGATTASGGDAGGEAGTGGAGTGGASTGGAGTGGAQTTGGTGGAGAGGASTGGGDTGWGPDQCPSPPDGVTVGIEPGQQLPEIIVADCDGNEYSLNNLCGSQAFWLFAAHGWCPLCQNVSANAEAIQDSFADQGLATAVVIVETGAGLPPSASYCKLWRDEHGLSDVVTLYDPTGAILDVWPGGSSSLSAFIDKNRVIVSKLQHESNLDTIKSNISAALSN